MGPGTKFGFSPFVDTRELIVEKGLAIDVKPEDMSDIEHTGCSRVGLLCTMIGRGEYLEGDDAPHVLIGGKLGIVLTGVIFGTIGLGKEGDGVFAAISVNNCR